MSFDAASLRAVILAAVAAVVLTLTVNAGYGLVIFQLRGAPPQEMLYQVLAGAPFIVMGLFLAAVAAILGARLAAHRAGRDPRLTSLAVGAGLALIVVAVSLVQGGLDVWLPPNAGMAVVGGWLGGWLAGRKGCRGAGEQR